jgi:hypothetical protein
MIEQESSEDGGKNENDEILKILKAHVINVVLRKSVTAD